MGEDLATRSSDRHRGAAAADPAPVRFPRRLAVEVSVLYSCTTPVKHSATTIDADTAKPGECELRVGPLFEPGESAEIAEAPAQALVLAEGATDTTAVAEQISTARTEDRPAISQHARRRSGDAQLHRKERPTDPELACKQVRGSDHRNEPSPGNQKFTGELVSEKLCFLGANRREVAASLQNMGDLMGEDLGSQRPAQSNVEHNETLADRGTPDGTLKAVFLNLKPQLYRDPFN